MVNRAGGGGKIRTLTPIFPIFSLDPDAFLAGVDVHEPLREIHADAALAENAGHAGQAGERYAGYGDVSGLA